jgi:hypothetical protein
VIDDDAAATTQRAVIDDDAAATTQRAVIDDDAAATTQPILSVSHSMFIHSLIDDKFSLVGCHATLHCMQDGVRRLQASNPFVIVSRVEFSATSLLSIPTVC